MNVLRYQEGFGGARRALCALVLSAASVFGATLGRVVPLIGGASDLVLDERRSQLYFTSSLQNQVQIYSIQKQTFLAPIRTDTTPLAAALSRDTKFLYVACYDAGVLDVVDLDALIVTATVPLPAKPEGVALANDGRVLISTAGSGTAGAANALLLYDPSPDAATPLTAISVAPAAATPPTLPPPSGRPFLATHSQLVATRDGSLIAGVNVPATGSPTVFIYEAASGTVLRARIVAGSSTVLAISDDGSRLMCGPNLFDAATLQVLAQQNIANAPFPVTPGTVFNVQSTQGGSVFSPDGQTLYAAFDISPVQNPPASPNVSQLLLNDPDNLLIRMGIQLPENLAGKMVVSADGSNVYALSDSGFTIVPAGTISRSPLAVPDATVALLTKDQCGVTAQTSSSVIGVSNSGSGRLTVTAQLLQYTGVANQASPATAPSVRNSPSSASAQLTFSFNTAAARGLGTVTPPHDFLIQSPEAINIPNRVRVYENSRDADARGAVIPIPGGTGEAFPDLIFDAPRQRLYIANSGLNRVEVFDIQQQAFLAPIKVGQLPNSMSLTPDGSTLYVANSGGESISIVDPDQMRTVGSVAFPPLPFNSNAALTTPHIMASSQNGPLVLMNNGSLWNVLGGVAIPRGVSRLLGQTSAGLPVALPAASSMVATPAGEFILLATNAGTAYLYSAAADDWVATRTITVQPGYVGPVAAGPGGQYYVVNGTILNQALTPQSTGAANRLISAVTALNNNSFAVYSPPAAPTAANTLPTAAPTVQTLGVANGNTMVQVSGLEGPITTVAANGRATISGRTMAVDSAGQVAYIITASGLSIIPLVPVSPGDRPSPKAGGAVNLASLQLPVAANGLLSIFGQNLATSDTGNAAQLPLILGGSCVTLNNIALPLLMTSPTQINAQIPPDLAPGTYPLVVRSIASLAASASQQLTVSKYGPAVMLDPNSGLPALFHADGKLVSKDNPASRDEPLTMYAVGLGPTTGGTVTAGVPSPSSPVAATGSVQVFFGSPLLKQSAIIVDQSFLQPGFEGVYELNLRIPGFHNKGDALPILIRLGNVNSPTSGPVVPYVSVD